MVDSDASVADRRSTSDFRRSVPMVVSEERMAALEARTARLEARMTRLDAQRAAVHPRSVAPPVGVGAGAAPGARVALPHETRGEAPGARVAPPGEAGDAATTARIAPSGARVTPPIARVATAAPRVE